MAHNVFLKTAFLFCCFSATLLTPTIAEVAPITLVKDGRATCTIVVGRDDRSAKAHTRRYSNLTYALPTNVLRDSAADMAHHLNEMAGIWNPVHGVKVVDDAKKAKSRFRILLGSAAIEVHGLEAEAAKISYPGYVYRTVGKDLLIFGSSSKGAANGVYGFLQDELGVRWFGPQDLFRVIPRKPTIQIGTLDKSVKPSFPGRLVHTVSVIESPAFNWGRRRMRMSEVVDEGEPFRNTSHNLWRIFRPATYFEKHPEYYAMNGSKRQPADQRTHHFAICYSNSEVIDVAARAALAYFKANPRRHSFSLGINDAKAYCDCTECAKLQPSRLFRNQQVASDMYFHFVNEVARRVRKEFPGRYIGAIAYNDVTPPPVSKMEENVHVVLVNDISEYYDAAYRARDEELVKAWEEKGITMGLYYYTQLAKLAPAYFPRLLAAELKNKHARGFTSVTSEMGNGWPWHGPMAYVEARLLWNIGLSVGDLLNEYFESLFGPAAEPMKKLYALLEEIHMRPRSGGFLIEHYKAKQFRPYTGDDLVVLRRLLAEAHAAIPKLGIISKQDGLEGRRVGYVSNGLKVFLDMLEGFSMTRRNASETASKTIDDVSAMAMLETIRRMNTLLDRHEVLYRETLINDSFLPGRFRRDTATPLREQWKRELANTVGKILVRLHRHDLKSGTLDKRVKALLQKAVARYEADEYRSFMFRFKTGELRIGKNRVVNPGFERIDKKSDFPPHLEWTASKAFGWASWQHAKGMGSFTTSDKVRRSGKRSGLMHGIGNGCYITTIPNVKSGQMYHVEAFIKNTAHVTRENKPTVKMETRWRDSNGRWTLRGVSFSDESSKLDEWVRLETIARIPEGAASAVILITAAPLENDEEVFVDDVSFRLLEKQ
jgi:hypothetical protein